MLKSIGKQSGESAKCVEWTPEKATDLKLETVTIFYCRKGLTISGLIV